MTDKKQTSIDWLFEQIPFEFSSSRAAFDAYQTAKSMHQQEIEHSVDAALYGYCKSGKDYFENTFKND